MKLKRLYLTLVLAVVVIFSCQKEIHFDVDTPPVTEPPPVDTTIADAQYTLINTPGECMIDSLTGFYVKGVAVDSSVCKIYIGVNVTKAGKYTITTDQKNGYGFSGSGIFDGTGNRTIVLAAQGTPGTSQQDVFNVSTGTSSCSFPIDVIDAVVVHSDSYFPLSIGSWWSYEDLTARGDTMMRTIADTNSVNGVVYTIMNEQKKGPERSYLFRENRGGEYYEYSAVDKYATSLSYIPAVYDEIFFMNQVLFEGTTWESADYTGTISGGQPILLKYSFTCIQRDAIVILNGKAFLNVNVVNMRPQVRSVDHAYNSTGEDYYYFYAKGVGIVYMIKYDLDRLQLEWRLKDWEVK